MKRDNPMDEIEEALKKAVEDDKEDADILWAHAGEVVDSMWRCFEALADIKTKTMAEVTRDLGFEFPRDLKDDLLKLM